MVGDGHLPEPYEDFFVRIYTLVSPCSPPECREWVGTQGGLRAGRGGVFKLTENCRNDIDNSPGRDGGREINKDSLAFTEI